MLILAWHTGEGYCQPEATDPEALALILAAECSKDTLFVVASRRGGPPRPHLSPLPVTPPLGIML